MAGHFDVRSKVTKPNPTSSGFDNDWFGLGVFAFMLLLFVGMSLHGLHAPTAKKFAFRLNIPDSNTEKVPTPQTDQAGEAVQEVGAKDEQAASDEEAAGTTEMRLAGEQVDEEELAIRERSGGRTGGRVFEVTNRSLNGDSQRKPSQDQIAATQSGAKLGSGQKGSDQPSLTPVVQILDRDDDGVPLIDVNQAPPGELASLPAIGDNLAKRIDQYRKQSGSNMPFPQFSRLEEAGLAANLVTDIKPFIMLEPDENEPIFRIEPLPHTLDSDEQPSQNSWRIAAKEGADWVSVHFTKFSVDARQAIEIRREFNSPPVAVYGGELGAFRIRAVASEDIYITWPARRSSSGRFVIDQIISYTLVEP